MWLSSHGAIKTARRTRSEGSQNDLPRALGGTWWEDSGRWERVDGSVRAKSGGVKCFPPFVRHFRARECFKHPRENGSRGDFGDTTFIKNPTVLKNA